MISGALSQVRISLCMWLKVKSVSVLGSCKPSKRHAFSHTNES